jgi:hypothetical protein
VGGCSKPSTYIRSPIVVLIFVVKQLGVRVKEDVSNVDAVLVVVVVVPTGNRIATGANCPRRAPPAFISASYSPKRTFINGNCFCFIPFLNLFFFTNYRLTNLQRSRSQSSRRRSRCSTKTATAPSPPRNWAR